MASGVIDVPSTNNSITFAIENLPAPYQVALSSTALSNTDFCEGEVVTFNASSSSTISTYTFYVGGIAIQSSPTNIFTPSPALSSSVSVTVLALTADSCGSSITLDMFYNDVTVKGTIGQVSTTICAGETPPAFTNVASATGIGEITYQWQARTFGTDFQNVPVSATTQVYTETSALNTTTFYRRKAISTFGGKPCEEFSNVIEVKVGSPPISTLQVQGTAISAPATITLCAGEDVTFNAAGGGAAEFLFYLDDNPLGVKSGSSTLSTSTLITGNRIKVESFDAIGCSSFSDEIVVQIVDNPVISLTSTAFASSASSSTFCEGEAITFNVTSTSAIATYTFIVGSSAVSVTTNNFYTTVPPLSSTTSVSVRVETAAGCTATQTLKMFLNEITSSGNIGQASATICSGETPPAFTNVASATGVGTISYQWQSRTFATDFINVPVSATTQVYTETSALNTTTFYRRSAISTFGGKPCVEFSNIIQVAIEDPPLTGLQVGAVAAPDTISICSGQLVTFNATGGGLSFQFYIDDNPIGTRSDSSLLSTSTLIDGSRVKVKSWTTNTATGGGCSSFSPEILINTSLDPTISLTSDAYSLTSTNSIFCEGDAITFTASSTSAIATYTFSVGGITYQSSSTNIFQPANLTPSILIPNGANVVVIASTPLGCTASATILMTENIVSPGLINTTSSTICFGEPAASIFNVTEATGSGVIEYAWEASIDNGVTFTPYPSSSNTSTLLNPGNLFQTTLFRRSAKSTIATLTSCTEYSNVVTITVLPQVLGGTITPTILTICSGEVPPQLNVVSGTIGPGVAYKWQISSDGVVFTEISTATGQSYTPSALNTTTFYRRVTTAGSGTASTCGNSGAKAVDDYNIRTLVVSTDPPTSSFVTDRNGAGRTPTSSATVDGTSAGVILDASMTAQGTKTFKYTVNAASGTPGDDGEKTVVVTATDKATQGNITIHGSISSSTNYLRFMLDDTAPSLTITPSAGSTTTQTKPYIVLDYSAQEATKVTLNTATLDGVDISGDLSTTDNKKFYYVPTSDLAAGEHTIVSKATDYAGNVSSILTRKFSVAARKDFKLTLLAGWNAKSVPSDPVNPAIDSVFSNSGVDMVLSYSDHTWTSATKDSGSGKFVGSLSEIHSGKGYWVHNNNFESQSVALQGPVTPTAGSPPAVVTISTVAGWNFIGVSDVTRVNTEGSDGTTIGTANEYFGDLKDTNTGGHDIVYEYNTTDLKFVEVAHGGNVSTGEGLWIYIVPAADGSILPIVPPAP